MRQSWLMSLVEAVTNVAVGYSVAVVTQLLVFPMFGAGHDAAADAEVIGAISPPVSLWTTCSAGVRGVPRVDCPAAALGESLTALPPVVLSRTRLRKLSL